MSKEPSIPLDVQHILDEDVERYGVGYAYQRKAEGAEPTWERLDPALVSVHLPWVYEVGPTPEERAKDLTRHCLDDVPGGSLTTVRMAVEETLKKILSERDLVERRFAELLRAKENHR